MKTPSEKTTTANPSPEGSSGHSFPEANSGVVNLHISKGGLFVMGLFVIIPWVVVISLVYVVVTRHPANTADASVTADPLSEKIHESKPGPWGNLEFNRIEIEPPDEFIPKAYETPNPVRWYFKDFNKERLTRFFDSVGLNDDQRQDIEDAAKWEMTANGIFVTPDQKLILEMSPDARSAIYSRLAMFPENVAQTEPFRFRADTVDEWFDQSGLSPDEVASIKRLLYPKGASFAFSDYDTVLSMIVTPYERSRLFKTLSRKTTLLVRLRVEPDSDIDELVDYWGCQGQSKNIRPFLTSLPKVAGGFTVDVSHLLPPFARKRLYTYPSPSSTGSVTNHDCFWTSLNFFNDRPNEAYAHMENVRKALAENYETVSGAPHYGDVILFVNAEGDAIHSCVYVADDIVFTKNGASVWMPWVLTELSDLKASYASDTPLHFHIYRLKKT